ncbi:MAG: hypothetical protein HY288_03905 [Planctomycetia bacterium]|nr:hypothetical protein [Planctomycetia bacterium]
MNKKAKTNWTPSLEEFTGWYNIRDDYGDGHPVLRSKEPMPEFEHAEIFELYPKAAKWFDQLVTARPNIPFDPLVEPPFFVRSDADDRTLDIDADFSYLTVRLLRRIQKEFLGRYPLWRVILTGEQPSCSIVIYPTAIRFGNLPADVDPEHALRELVPRVLALRAARERPQREHISRLQRLLPGAVERIGDRPFLVCGMLGNYKGDYSRLTICLLIRGADSDAIDIDGPLGSPNDLLWCGSAFSVDAKGAIISYIHVPETALFCLARWLPLADYRGPLVVCRCLVRRR